MIEAGRTFGGLNRQRQNVVYRITLGPLTPQLTERSWNVYENKGACGELPLELERLAQSTAEVRRPERHGRLGRRDKQRQYVAWSRLKSRLDLQVDGTKLDVYENKGALWKTLKVGQWLGAIRSR